MTLKTIPLSALCPSEGNPRRTVDDAKIASLAESIKTDGVLQNLVVEEADTFRVVSGMRRFLAMKLLADQGAIDGDYKVPAEIRRNLKDGDGRRIAIVENVQRADLDPIDEAEAFAEMLQNGGDLDDLSAKTGLSQHTIRRRLAFANLCDPVKEAVRNGELSLGIAESMTLGTEDQQQALLHDIREGADLDRDAIRELLLTEKPSAAVAIFPLEKYTGTFTRDLFGDEESTFFDDVEQFFVLQNEAVEALAEQQCKEGAEWVDVLNTYAVNWWLYREAEEGEPAGVVINLKPTGIVEVEKGLARHEVKEEVVEATSEAPEAPRKRPAVSSGLIRYVALQKSVVVQAALLANPRKLKEVVATCLLLAFGSSGAARIEAHPCLTAFAASKKKPQAFVLVYAEASRFLNRVGMSLDGERVPIWTGANGNSPLELYEAVQTFSNEDLERITELVVLLSFGQCGVEKLDTERSLFNGVAADLGLALRDWWTPDEEFLALMRKDQLESVAIESAALLHMGKFKHYSKKELVGALARYFERTADPTATLDEHDQRGRVWLPGAMSFPAREAVTMPDPD